ncbi:acyloxyacyl hydrolase [Candidatus Tisiphia endosymbiont of Ceraclea dissimilis]|uniref:acyloxyacyl hydrolase n=1 Tax=Candidatus Tisiphia endosymbiont of Ceraclea dissimilis TaxID=3077928 RepID=UPI003CCAD761
MKYKKIQHLIFLILLLIGSRTMADEMRIGVLRHDLGYKFGLSGRSRERIEKGCDFNLEWLFEKYKFLYAYPHIGTSINSDSYTSHIYTGITWHFDMTKCVFFEASFGFAIHNGEIEKLNQRRRALGTRFLFRESLSLGVVIQEKHAVSLIIDHLSNAKIVKLNPGLTNLGVRYGYKF